MNKITNVEIHPSGKNGLSKKSVADCLQTRPVDYRARIKGVRGELEAETMELIDRLLVIREKVHSSWLIADSWEGVFG